MPVELIKGHKDERFIRFFKKRVSPEVNITPLSGLLSA
jgi:hypothetical protein